MSNRMEGCFYNGEAAAIKDALGCGYAVSQNESGIYADTGQGKDFLVLVLDQATGKLLWEIG